MLFLYGQDVIIMAYSTIVTKDEGAVIIVDNIDTKRNKAEHKIIQLNKEAKIYLVSFGKYELDGLVWDSLIKGFQMRVNQPIATFKECTLRFEEYLRSLKDNYRKDIYIQRIIWTALNNLTLNGGIQSLVENINRVYGTLSIDKQVNEETTPILINELVNFLNQNQISIDQESFNKLVEISCQKEKDGFPIKIRPFFASIIHFCIIKKGKCYKINALLSVNHL